ncbi:zinc metalloprotease [Natrialbaceae archaeon A-gly3]
MSGSWADQPGYRGETELSFSDTELRDLGIAWITLSVAFSLFLNPPAWGLFSIPDFLLMTVLSFFTVGVAFLLHELAHKVVAIKFGQTAEFRADYGMLFFAIMSALIGFLFAAPGAVYHRGRITVEQNGIIALAGPVTNLGLAVAFFPLVFLPGVLGTIGNLGVIINLFLATFNMLPFGPLDGKSVIRWSKQVFWLAFGVSLFALIAFYLLFGLSF